MEKDGAKKPRKTKLPVLSGKDFEAISADIVKREASSISDAQLKKALLNLLAGLDKSDYPELQRSLAGYAAYMRTGGSVPTGKGRRRPTSKKLKKVQRRRPGIKTKKEPSPKVKTVGLRSTLRWAWGGKKKQDAKGVSASSFLKKRPSKVRGSKMRRAFRKVKKWIF